MNVVTIDALSTALDSLASCARATPESGCESFREHLERAPADDAASVEPALPRAPTPKPAESRKDTPADAEPAASVPVGEHDEPPAEESEEHESPLVAALVAAAPIVDPVPLELPDEAVAASPVIEAAPESPERSAPALPVPEDVASVLVPDSLPVEPIAEVAAELPATPTEDRPRPAPTESARPNPRPEPVLRPEFTASQPVAEAPVVVEAAPPEKPDKSPREERLAVDPLAPDDALALHDAAPIELPAEAVLPVPEVSSERSHSTARPTESAAAPASQPAAADAVTAPATTVDRLAERLLPRHAEPARGFVEVDPARFLHRVARAFEAARERGGDVRLRLHPPELGALKLEVRMVGEQLTARLEAETQAARTLLLDSLPQLRERLAEQGLKVERFDVELSDRRPPDQPQGRPDHRPPDGGAERPRRPTPAVTPTESTERPTVRGRHAGQINVFV